MPKSPRQTKILSKEPPNDKEQRYVDLMCSQPGCAQTNRALWQQKDIDDLEYDLKRGKRVTSFCDAHQKTRG
jgi:hypothetical protein